MAVRFYPTIGIKNLKIRSYDNTGRQIAEKTVQLSEGSQHFVLVRTVDNTMYAYPSQKIWSQNI